MAGFLVLDRVGSGRVLFELARPREHVGEMGLWAEIEAPRGRTRERLERHQVLSALAVLDGARRVVSWRVDETLSQP